MNVDTKLCEASESVRQARREAHFTSRPPARRLQTRRRPILAAAAAFVLVVGFGVPALLYAPGADQTGDVGAGVDADSGFPLLILDSGDWYANSARDILDETGERVGTWVGYTNPAGGDMALTVRRVAEDHLLADEPDPAGGPEAEALSMATESRLIDLQDGEAVLYVIPADSRSEEGSLFALRWIPRPGAEAVMFTSRTEEDATVGLANDLIPTDEGTWSSLTSTNGAVPTTIGDGTTGTTLATEDQDG
ncbi:MAG TPA: hypothetical protein VJ935_03075 [Acidimicrobiia bacterium]|nr:hypothetical protein [Acidimicrobiia bacterium]